MATQPFPFTGQAIGKMLNAFGLAQIIMVAINNNGCMKMNRRPKSSLCVAHGPKGYTHLRLLARGSHNAREMALVVFSAWDIEWIREITNYYWLYLPLKEGQVGIQLKLPFFCL